MVWVDIAILVIISLSALISIWRGFIREALSLVGWIVAFWVGLTFGPDFSVYLQDYVEQTTLRLGLSFFILFITTLLLTALINYLASQLIEKTGLTGTDRMLGVFFGIARGGLIVAILVLLAGLTRMPEDSWWAESIFIHHFETAAAYLRELVPETGGEQFVNRDQ